MKYIHLTNGNYLGFITNNNLFSRDGNYLGWLEHDTVWDGTTGEYKGKVLSIGSRSYILRPQFAVSPIPRIPRVPPVPPMPPMPVANTSPIFPPLGYTDAFKI